MSIDRDHCALRGGKYDEKTVSVKKREKMWAKLGGKARKKADIDMLPGRKHARRRGD
ncbi:hypothetical protein Q2941_11205 [Bradyrhizobium sp. UFLA05-153]